MSTLFYSVMGEGRGHAARARAVVERLREGRRWVLFASHDALAFLRGCYPEDTDGIEVREIPGLHFHYSASGLDNGKTVREGLAFYRGLRRHVDDLARHFDRDRPDLAITDFEPLLPRAARRVGTPVLSLDHQHFLTTYDLSGLPLELRAWAWMMSWSIRAFGIRQTQTVVSAFYRPQLRRGYEHVTQVGPLLREAIASVRPSRGPHLLSYLRRATPPSVLDVLADAPLPVKVYGLGKRPPRGAVSFCEIDEQAFVDDLASCDAVVSAAGNQLMGESIWLGKPVLALPERSHYEQRINAEFVQRMGAGEQRVLQDLRPEDLAHFLDRRDAYRKRMAETPLTTDGVPQVERVVEAMLAGHARRPRAEIREPV
ncbi:glycosyltransferase family protein [Botrimarina sp.]|uniref:glycosyltransferase family protein n=1 Tax=Botrimarina sp. TaxID=2795802 RepID=UPI0032EC5C0F